jgi:hypothetical protein
MLWIRRDNHFQPLARLRLCRYLQLHWSASAAPRTRILAECAVGVTLAPLDFGRFSHDLLVGQFANAGNTESAGVIAASDLVTGKFAGLIQGANGQPLIIQGIWSCRCGWQSTGQQDCARSDSSAVEAGTDHLVCPFFRFISTYAKSRRAS